MSEPQCEAINVCQSNDSFVRGERCRERAKPGDTLCWLHRGAIEAGTRTERGVREGLSAAEASP